MAAGLGFKTFTTGEVLTATDTNGYLMQGVLVFASAAARDAAITSPQEGQFAYLKDTNVTTYYTGSAWANLDTTGMTNPMTTTGDTIYSSSGSTPARLGIGTTGQVLTVASGIPSWATPAAGGAYTQIATGSLTGASVTISSISGSYKNLRLLLVNPSPSTAAKLLLRYNGYTSSYSGVAMTDASVSGGGYAAAISNSGYDSLSSDHNGWSWQASTTNGNFLVADFYDYTQANQLKTTECNFSYGMSLGYKLQGTTTSNYTGRFGAITSIEISWSTGNHNSGTYYLYGVN